jgi:peptidoglycan/xylan/chitin deacetylase (PgdA/CDA1 family)
VTRSRSLWWRATGRRGEPGVRLLFYHRVSDDRDELAVSRRGFRAQMEELARQGYEVLDVPAAARAALEVTAGGSSACSFDDGYLDVAENGVPVLERLGFRATIFLATVRSSPGRRASRGTGTTEPPVLDWESVRELDGSAVSFEAHSVTHPNLVAPGRADAEREIADSKRELEERLGRPVTTFSYPAGLFGPRERELCARAGYTYAVTCEPGVNGPRTDPLALRRRQIDGRDSLLDFKAKLGGGHDTPLPLRGAYRRLRYPARPRMRIAYACHWNMFLGDGVAKKIRAQTAAWREAGHEVELFWLAKDPGHPIAEEGTPFLFEPPLGRPLATRRLDRAASEFRPDVAYLRYHIFLPPLPRLFRIAPVAVEVNADDDREFRLWSKRLWLYNKLNRGSCSAVRPGSCSSRRSSHAARASHHSASRRPWSRTAPIRPRAQPRRRRMGPTAARLPGYARALAGVRQGRGAGAGAPRVRLRPRRRRQLPRGRGRAVERDDARPARRGVLRAHPRASGRRARHARPAPQGDDRGVAAQDPRNTC